MTRKWGTAYSARFDSLVWRQKATGLSGRICEICMKEEDKEGKTRLIIEHVDNDEANYRMENLRLAHQSCNIAKNPPNQFPKDIPKERVGEIGEDGREWTSKEGARSEKMTYRYRQKLYHPQTGLMRNAGQQFDKKALAIILEEECGIGKWITYIRYLEADIGAGYLNLTEVDGADKLERSFKEYPLARLGIKPQEKSSTLISKEEGQKHDS